MALHAIAAQPGHQRHHVAEEDRLRGDSGLTGSRLRPGRIRRIRGLGKNVSRQEKTREGKIGLRFHRSRLRQGRFRGLVGVARGERGVFAAWDRAVYKNNMPVGEIQSGRPFRVGRNPAPSRPRSDDTLR